MVAQLEILSPLGRKLFVEIPANEISAEVDTRIKKLMETVRIDGFRKGKVPHKVIHDRYGEGVFSEVIRDSVNKSLEEALTENSLRPASRPQVEHLQAEKEEPLRYEITFEIYPEVAVADLSQISLERKVASISDADVEEVIERVRKQQADWQPVERMAEEGDKLMLDVKVEVEGASLEDMHDLAAELGTKTMIPGFEEGLTGAKAGDEVILHLTFPDPYFDPKVAGKPAKFTIYVSQVLESQLPSDELLAEKLATKEGIEGIKENVREHIQREANRLAKSELKNQLWDKLVEIHSFDLPESLVEQELHHMLHPETSHEDAHHHHDATEEQREQAKRHVKIGLLLSEVVNLHQLKPDPERLRAKIGEMVSMFENPAQMVKLYSQNKDFLMRLQADTLEDQVVDELLKTIQVVDREVSYNEMFKKL